MSVRRLTDADKSQIVELYRTPGETAATLAEQFGVSNTTIGRILKAGIPPKDYELIVQQKRRGGDPAAVTATLHSEPSPEVESPPEVVLTVETPAEILVVTPERLSDLQPDVEPERAEPIADQRRSRRRSSAPIPVATPAVEAEPEPEPEPVLKRVYEPEPVYDEDEILDEPPEFLPERTKKVIQVGIRATDDTAKRSNDRPVRRSDASYEQSYDDAFDEDDDDDLLPPVTEEIAAIMDEDFDNSDETDEIEDDLEDEDDIDDEESLNSARELLSLQVASLMKVRPFEEADMPRTCYLVIDRAAELVVRPLGDFGDLGSLPEAQKTLTLPIFDNHRVAKRFATDRTQRVIKVPDSQIFYKTAYQLRSKGITHLFVDGQIYSL